MEKPNNTTEPSRPGPEINPVKDAVIRKIDQLTSTDILEWHAKAEPGSGYKALPSDFVRDRTDYLTFLYTEPIGSPLQNVELLYTETDVRLSLKYHDNDDKLDINSDGATFATLDSLHRQIKANFDRAHQNRQDCKRCQSDEGKLYF